MKEKKDFITKDSGKRQDYASGMRRDLQEGKPRYELVYKPMLTRWAYSLTRGAEKYGANNWQLANSIEEMDRFLGSLERHLQQYLNAIKVEVNEILEEEHFHDIDMEEYEKWDGEDHAAGVFFNISCAEYLKKRLYEKKKKELENG